MCINVKDRVHLNFNLNLTIFHTINHLCPKPTDLQQPHKRSGNTPTVVAGAAASPSASGSLINREVRIGVTYAYVELANLLGPEWLEKNLRLYLLHVLNLVNNTKAVSTHLDAVYSRKCVQFILRSIIGGMLNEKVVLAFFFLGEKCPMKYLKWKE